MIRSYGDAKTERFAQGARVKPFESFRRQAEKVLDRKLSGDLAGQYSVRVNDQWRICFEWPKGSAGPEKVTIEDYH
jgi:proteic killer suppression protein